MGSAVAQERAGSAIDPLAARLGAELAAEPVEVAAFAFCAADGAVLGRRRFISPAPDRIDLPVRGIVAAALLLDAVRVVMAHNHPRGDAWPSRADRDVTLRLSRALEAVETRLVDHVVVGRDGALWSFRAAGLL